MADTSNFRNGLIINRKNALWKIVEFLHVKPGKGPAFVRTKIRNLNTGRLLENTFTSGVKLWMSFIHLSHDLLSFNPGNMLMPLSHNSSTFNPGVKP